MLFLSSMACCFAVEGLAYEQDLVGDYAVWAVDTQAWTAVVRKETPTPGRRARGGAVVIPAMVFAYGWNEGFVIAKQHPNADFSSEVNTEVINWYILEVKTGEVHGPLTEEEFLELRQELGVPESLAFTKTVRLSGN